MKLLSLSRRFPVVAAIALLAMVVGFARADLFVDGINGNDATTDGTTLGTAYKTIGAAVAKAVGGDTIQVQTGEYGITALIAVTTNVTIRSITGKPGDVVVKRSSGTIGIFALSNAGAALKAITIQGGNLSANYAKGSGVCITGGGGRVENCILRGHTIGGWDSKGGAIYCDSAAGYVSHCVISNNTSSSNLGGTALYMTAGKIDNSLITRNSHNTSAYIVGNVTMTSGTMTNCTIAGNSGYVSAGVKASETAQVRNCLIADNTMTLSASATDAYYVGTASCFASCAAPVLINDNCYTGILNFVAPEAANYRLAAGSVAIDHGATTGFAPGSTDLDGNPRFDTREGIIDIGCYEFAYTDVAVATRASAASGLAPFIPTFYADFLGETNGAVSYAWSISGDITDSRTTYVPSLAYTFANPGSYAVTVTLTDNNGSYASTNTAYVVVLPGTLYVSPDSPSPAAPYTSWGTAAHNIAEALAAAGHGSKIIVSNGSYKITAQLDVTKAVALRGITGAPEHVVVYDTLTSGKHRLLYLNAAGATVSGMAFSGGWPTVGNDARGGNIFIDKLGGTVSNCVIRNGRASGWAASGGGIYIESGAAEALVTHCVITNNIATEDNSTTAGGFGIHIRAGNARNCLIACNHNPDGSTGTGMVGAVNIQGGTLANCTIAKNTARNCSGIYAQGGTVVNCVVSENTTTVSTDPNHPVWAGTASYFNRCLAPVLINANCYQEANSFAASASGNFALAPGSTGIENGTALAWMTSGATDLAGNDRIRGDYPDIGAYESDPDAFAAAFVPNVDEGFAPLDVTFTVTPSGEGSSGVTCYWDFDGDGDTDETTSELTIAHSFTAYGDYHVMLKVKDNQSGVVYETPGYQRVFAAPRTMYVVAPGVQAASVYPFGSWVTAATNLADAISAAINGTQIVLTNGIHKTPVAAPFYVTKDVTICGATDRPEDVEVQMLGSGHRIFELNSAGARLAGLSLEGKTRGNGNTVARGALVYIDTNGGGVSNCILRGGAALLWSSYGAAAYMNAGTITHCVISNNAIQYADFGKPMGMAVAINGGTLANSLMAYNKPYSVGTTPASGGGAVYATGGLVMNCTIVSNSYDDCAGVYATGGEVVNCIIAANTSTLAGGAKAVWSGTESCFNTCGSPETLINEDCFMGSVSFVDIGSGNFRLDHRAGNAGYIDGGVTTGYPIPSVDLDGRPRLVHRGRIDLGCYEADWVQQATVLMIR